MTRGQQGCGDILGADPVACSLILIHPYGRNNDPGPE